MATGGNQRVHLELPEAALSDNQSIMYEEQLLESIKYKV